MQAYNHQVPFSYYKSPGWGQACCSMWRRLSHLAMALISNQLSLLRNTRQKKKNLWHVLQSFWQTLAFGMPSPVSRLRRLSGGFLKKMTKSPLHSLSQLQKERLIFSVRFQIMKGRTSLADVPCFHQADSYLLGFICQQISAMWQKYILQL